MTITSFGDLRRYSSKIFQIARNYKGRNVRAWGAILQDGFHPSDKIHLIIEFDCHISHTKHIRLERALSNLLHHDVRVVIPEEEVEDKRKQMLEEAVPLRVSARRPR